MGSFRFGAIDYTKHISDITMFGSQSYVTVHLYQCQVFIQFHVNSRFAVRNFRFCQCANVDRALLSLVCVVCDSLIIKLTEIG